MEVKTLIEQLWNSHQAQYPVQHPGFWMIVLNEIQENYQAPEEDGVQWHNLLKAIIKLIQIWLKKSKKWEITSSIMLLENLLKVPGDTLAMSFSTDLMTTFINLFNAYALMEEPDETECLHFQSNQTMSMLSTIVHSQVDTAGTSSGSRLNLSERLAQLVPKTNRYGSSPEQTGMMSSSISFLENQELVRYGLEEKIGKNRITVRLFWQLISYFYLVFIAQSSYSSIGTMAREV